MSNQDNPLKNFIKLSGLGIQIGVIVYIFIYFGKRIDLYLNNNTKTFVAIGAITGVALSLYVVLKQLEKIHKE
ncbi:MAG: AtpZ/AtpI family protein [Flavobacteriaceae bacterium]